jgi:energy-coupling factor transporter ATP-binding protein EcfA2
MSLKIETPHLALFMARRNSGKTTLMKHLLGVLARAKKFRWVTVVSATAFTQEWQAVVGERHVLPQFDPEWLDQLLRRQAALKEDGVDNPGLLILDDCLGTANFGSEIFTRIASAGRHYGVSVWASFQHYHKCPTVLRTNADLVFCLNVQNDRVARAIFEEYGPPGFKVWQALKAFAQKASKDFGALCLDNARGGKALVVRAPKSAPPFKISQ